MMRASFHRFLALLLATGGLWSCAEPDLGTTPFLCNRGLPECPDGYTCQKQDPTNRDSWFCVKDGTQRPPNDGGPAEAAVDSGPRPDGQVQQDTGAPKPLVVITEFLADPKAVGDDSGEWFELHNGGNVPVDLKDWTIKDDGAESHRIATSVQIPAKGFVVLAAVGEVANNGGVTAAYAYGYGNFRLSNTTDAIILLDASGQEVDRVSYSVASGFQITAGASLSVRGNPFGDKSESTAWCTEAQPWSGSKGDFGTPGRNPSCQ